MNENASVTYIKGIFTAVFSVLTSLFGVLAVPILLMVGANVIDYATGLIAAPKRSEDINSYKSMRGILEKGVYVATGSCWRDHRRADLVCVRYDWHHASRKLSGGLHCSLLDYL